MLRRTLRLLSRYCSLHRPGCGRPTSLGLRHGLPMTTGTLCSASYNYNAATGESRAARCSGCRSYVAGESIGLPLPSSHSGRGGLTLQTDGTLSLSAAEMVTISSPAFGGWAADDKSGSSDGSTAAPRSKKPVLISLPVLLL